MSNEQSLANQLGLCISMQNILNETTSTIRSVVADYDNTVALMRQAQYIAELTPEIHSMQREFQKICDDLVRHIEQEHQTYIQSQSQHIQSIISDILSK